MSIQTGTVPARDRRIVALDVLRGIALIAMAVYHFTWDLEFFGYVYSGTAGTGGWRLFARGIATSFLLLVGVSLVLAHARGVRWRSFGIRLAQVVAGAAVITLATFLVTPQSFVFFGILHQIAVASVIGLAFLRLPALVTALCGVAIIVAGNLFADTLFDSRWLAWIGFSVSEPLSNDIVPIFPWTGIVLVGIALGHWGERSGAFEWARRWNARAERLTPLTFIGRHALAFYLIHQPVSLALIGAYAQLYPADQLAAFPEECRRGCIAQNADEAYCVRYCACAQDGMSQDGLLDEYVYGRLTPEREQSVRDVAMACSFGVTARPPEE